MRRQAGGDRSGGGQGGPRRRRAQRTGSGLQAQRARYRAAARRAHSARAECAVVVHAPRTGSGRCGVCASAYELRNRAVDPVSPYILCSDVRPEGAEPPNTTRSCGRGPPSPLTCRRWPCAVRRGTLSLLRPCGAAQWASFVPYIPHGNVFFRTYSRRARWRARRPPSIAATLARRAPSQLPHATLARCTFPIYRARRWRGGPHLSPRRWRGAPPSQ